MSWVEVLIATMLIVHLAIAKPVVAQESSWQPTKPPAFALQSPAIAKVYGDDKGSTVLGLILFSPYQQETRVREVRDPKTGENLTQEYQVQVPITNDKGEWVFERKRVELPLENAEIWSSGGQLLDADAARKALATPKRCLLMDTRYQKLIKDPIEKFYAEVLEENVFIVRYDPEKCTLIDPPTPSPAPTPTPE